MFGTNADAARAIIKAGPSQQVSALRGAIR